MPSEDILRVGTEQAWKVSRSRVKSSHKNIFGRPLEGHDHNSCHDNYSTTAWVSSEEVVGNPNQARAGIILSQLDLEVVLDHHRLCKATMTHLLCSKRDSQNLNLEDHHPPDRGQGTSQLHPVTTKTNFLTSH